MALGPAVRTILQYRRSATLFTALTQALTAGLSLLSGPLLARSVGADGRGVVAGVTVTLTVLSWICFLSVPQALGYYSHTGRDALASRLALVTIGLGAATACGLWFLAPHLAHPGETLEITGLRAGALLLPFCGLALCGLESMYARGQLRAWNVVRCIPTAGGALGVIGLYLAGHLSTGSAVAANLTALGVYCVFGIAQLVPSLGRGEVGSRMAIPLRFAMASWLAGSSLALFGRLDQVLMVPFSTTDRLGRYAVAVTVVASANLIPASIGVVAYTRTRLAKEKVLENWLIARRRLYWFGGAANLTVVIVGPWLLPFLFGPEFRGLALVILVLAAGQLINDQWMLRVNTLTGIGEQRQVVLPSWTSTAVFVLVLLGFGSGVITELDAACATLVCALIRPAVFRLRSGSFTAVLRELQQERIERKPAAGVPEQPLMPGS